uniref:Secreted protein n=1 Tax=Arundo donax TaxID=35708 RepID=A0A0A9EE25_ARUDO
MYLCTIWGTSVPLKVLLLSLLRRSSSSASSHTYCCRGHVTQLALWSWDRCSPRPLARGIDICLLGIGFSLVLVDLEEAAAMLAPWIECPPRE